MTRTHVAGHPFHLLRDPGMGRRSRAFLARLGGRLGVRLADIQLRRRRLPPLTAEAVGWGRRHGVEAVWAVLNQTPMSWYLGRAVAEALGVPLWVTVMDPPESHYAAAGLAPGTIGPFDAAFDATMRRAARLSTASPTMRDAYHRRWGKDGEVLIHGVARAAMVAPAENPPGDRLRIGFAGSLYAGDEWRALLRALGDTRWVIDGRPVVLRVLGNRMDVTIHGPAHIEHLGWRAVDEAVSLLAETDVCYLPYWLGHRWSTSTRLCFPNKLATYAAAGRPVMVHGPADAMPATFVRDGGMGTVCDGADGGAILDALRAAVDPGDWDRRRAGIRDAAARLSLESFLAAFGRFAGLGAGWTENV